MAPWKYSEREKNNDGKRRTKSFGDAGVDDLVENRETNFFCIN